MKINDANLHGPGGAAGTGSVGGAGQSNASAKTARGSKSADPGITGRSEDGDRFQLSGLGQALRSEEIGSPERQARVEQLHSEFQSGKYHPDSLAVARSIVQDALDSPNSSPPNNTPSTGTPSTGGPA